jgi:pimeloyl-ACP methyl ester carboxylesterase
MEKATSKDGTPIAYLRQGDGPPLVLVHGAGSIAKRWLPILPELERHFTVYAIDRRGRGESGDNESYAFEREVEDILAVVDSIDQPVNLLGHSFGAACSLEAALLTENLIKLLLYEPPIPLHGIKILPDGLMDGFESMLNQGKNEEALIFFYRKVGISSQEISLMQSTPEWSDRDEAAHTILRESRFTEQYIFTPEQFKNLKIPTLLMVGSDSAPWGKRTTEALSQALPNSAILVLNGQKHAAMVTAPDMFVEAVIRFFED